MYVIVRCKIRMSLFSKLFLKFPAMFVYLLFLINLGISKLMHVYYIYNGQFLGCHSFPLFSLSFLALLISKSLTYLSTFVLISTPTNVVASSVSWMITMTSSLVYLLHHCPPSSIHHVAVRVNLK